MSPAKTPPSAEEPEAGSGGAKKAAPKKAAGKKAAVAKAPAGKAATKKAPAKKAPAPKSAAPEPVLEPEPVVEAEPEAVVETEPVTEPAAATEPAAVTEVEAAPVMAQDVAPEAAAEPDPQPAPEPVPETEAAAVPEPAPTPEPPAAAEPIDPKFQTLIDSFRERLTDGFVASEVVGGDLWIRVDASQWRRAAEVAKNELGMDYFCFLSGIDWLPNPLLAGRDVWDPNPNEASEVALDEPAGTIHTGIAGGDTRFQVFARLYSTRTHVGLTLKADLDDERPTAPSITSVYRGADWHEREAWEMYGFDFEGHPGLRHLYLPGEFEGHPLRKDFPMLAREVKPWPGLVDKEQIPGEAADPESSEEAAAT